MSSHTSRKGNINDLNTEVIYKGICINCGACVAFCPEYLTFEDGEVKQTARCNEYVGECYEFCPRSFCAPMEAEKQLFGEKRVDPALGYYKEIVTAKIKDAKIASQAGDDVITALLLFALSKKKIDSAVIARSAEKGPNMPKKLVATTAKEITAKADSKYIGGPFITGIGEAIRSGKEKIAFAGVPCQIQAIRNIQTSPNFKVGADRVVLVIGQFCAMGKFPVEKGEKYGRRDGCKVCYDFAAELADISAGSIGSEKGWTTLIMRSDAGKELVDEAVKAGAIEIKKLDDVSKIIKTATNKKQKNFENINEVAEMLKVLNFVMEPSDLKLFLV